MCNKTVSNMENVEMKKALFSVYLPLASFALFSILSISYPFHFYNLYISFCYHNHLS